MAAVLAHDPKNKTPSSPTSSRCTTVASRIKSWKEGARRALDKSFRITNKTLNDVLHGVTSKPYRPVTKQASSSFRFSTGAGTQQSQSIEAGTQQPQFIEAGTQQPQSITPTAQDGRQDSSFIGAGTQQPQFITPTAHQDGRRDASTTALSGVPGGPGHPTTTALPGVPGGPGHSTTTALPGVPGGPGHSTTALPGVPGGREHSTRALPEEYLEYLEFLLRTAQNHLLPTARDSSLPIIYYYFQLRPSRKLSTFARLADSS